MADDEEGVVDNWEDADTEELERRMEERHKQLQPIKVIKIKTRPPSERPPAQHTDTSTNTVSVVEPQTQLPLKIQDSDRTEYVAPIKILKRKPEGSSSPHPQHSSPQTSSSQSGACNPPSTKQYKTLAEREAEYASARARILGSDYRSDDAVTSTSPSQNRSPIATPKTVGASDNIKRLPRGPNDSKGFTKTETS